MNKIDFVSVLIDILLQSVYIVGGRKRGEVGERGGKWI